MRVVPSYIDQKLLFFLVALMGVGLVLVFSASSVTSLERFNDKFYVVKIQAMWMLIGVFAAYIFTLVDYRQLQRLAVPLLGITVVLLVLVYVPGLGRRVHGATRWLVIWGRLGVQPAEIAKLATILFLSDNLARNYRKRHSFREHLLPNLLVLGCVAALILRQPNLSMCTLILAVGFLTILVAHQNLVHLAGLCMAGAATFLILLYAEPYRLRRLMVFVDPFADPSGAGYQITQSLMALGSGGFSGVGIGQGLQKMKYLPFVNTDFIFAVLGEEMGMMGALAVIALFLGFLWRGFRIALHAPDLFGLLLAYGITVSILLQALINMAVVIALVPTTGVPLPFISYGGSNMLFTLASVGVLLNISGASERDTMTKLSRRWAPAEAR